MYYVIETENNRRDELGQEA